MKKYVKPELFYERYELTEQIAACAWDLNSSDESVCGFKGDSAYGLPNEWVILVSKDNNCGITEYQDYCYYTGPNGMNTFNS